MHWMKERCALLLLLMPAFVLAMPAFAHDPALSNSQEPGSVIVFPKFIFESPGAIVDGQLIPRTEIEVTAVCPTGAVCIPHSNTSVRFHWVCPGNLFGQLVCKATEFDVTFSLGEKVVFSPDGVAFPGITTRSVPAPECGRGYLIGWVVNAAGRPIKFDGLIGDAVLRHAEVSAYGAIPIQAHPGLPHGAPITLGPAGALMFDGRPGHYQAVAGAIRGDLKYWNQEGVGPFIDTFFTLLTLDVQFNRPNIPVVINLDFYGGFDSIIGVGNVRSASTEFVCWEEVHLSVIDFFLQPALMGRKGTFISHPAGVTLLGLVETQENFGARSYITPMYNDGVAVRTVIRP
jgi:hypothetical protein